MPKKLKTWIGNLDGRREGLVIATSQRAAAKAINTSLHDFRDYWSVASDQHGEGLEPGALYTRPFDSREPWTVGLCQVRKHHS